MGRAWEEQWTISSIQFDDNSTIKSIGSKTECYSIETSSESFSQKLQTIYCYLIIYSQKYNVQMIDFEASAKRLCFSTNILDLLTTVLLQSDQSVQFVT